MMAVANSTTFCCVICIHIHTYAYLQGVTRVNLVISIMLLGNSFPVHSHYVNRDKLSFIHSSVEKELIVDQNSFRDGDKLFMVICS